MLSGVGALLPTVDTSLEKKELAPGEEMRGVAEVKGGGTEQEVEDPYVYVQTHYKRESGDTPVSEAGTVKRFPVADRMPVGANAREGIPFSFRLPYDTPLTIGRSTVWLERGLDVRAAFGPSDRDRITVRRIALS